MLNLAWCAAGAGFFMWRRRAKALRRAIGALICVQSGGHWISADDVRKAIGQKVSDADLLKAVNPYERKGKMDLNIVRIKY